MAETVEVGKVADLAEPDGVEAWIEANTLEARHVRVYRLQGDGRRQLLETFPAEGFRLDSIRPRFGGGKYQVMVLDEAWRYVKSERVEISGRPRVGADLDDDDPEDAPEAPRTDGTAAALLEAVRELQSLSKALQNPPRAVREAPPMDTAAAIVGAIQQATTPLITALIEARTPRPAPAPQGPSLDELLKVLRIGMTLSRGREATPADRALDEVGIPMVKWLMQQPGAPGAPPSGALPAGAPNGAPPAPPGPPWLAMVEPWIVTLTPMAEAQRSPEVYAEVILDQLTPAQEQLLREAVRRGGGDAARAQLVDRVPVHLQAWFGEVFDGIRAVLLQDDDDDPSE